MSTRSLAPSVYVRGVRGVRGLHTLRLLLGLFGAWLLYSCSWDPIARSAQPKRLFEGPTRVERLVSEGRYAIVYNGVAESERVRLVKTDNFEWCELPAGSLPFSNPLTAPLMRTKDMPLLLLPVVKAEAEVLQLYFSDEKCTLLGPFGSQDGNVERLQLKGDGRQIALLLDKAGVLRLIDPWSNQVRVLAENARFYTSVDQDPAATSTPQALWIFEGGSLTQRALDGTLLLKVGTKVSGFAQTLLRDGLRVSFRDGLDLFEARSPDFTPVLIAEDACRPEYANAALDFRLPCERDQLVRVDLTTGQVRRFPEGVFRVFPLGEFEAQQVHGPEGDELWVASGPTLRVKLDPPPQAYLSPLDRGRLAALTGDGQFGVWSLRDGFTPVVQGVVGLDVYRLRRTNQLLWLMLHDVTENFGRLSIFDQTDLERVLAGAGPLDEQTLAQQVPIDGSGYQTGEVAQREPVLLTIEQGYRQESDERFAGTLRVSLLSGTLASYIDDGVSSFQLVVAPLPGILYGVSEGENSGLWFAAL
jgi:hypothetical protein